MLESCAKPENKELIEAYESTVNIMFEQYESLAKSLELINYKLVGLEGLKERRQEEINSKSTTRVLELLSENKLDTFYCLRRERVIDYKTAEISLAFFTEEKDVNAAYDVYKSFRVSCVFVVCAYRVNAAGLKLTTVDDFYSQAKGKTTLLKSNSFWLQ